MSASDTATQPDLSPQIQRIIATGRQALPVATGSVRPVFLLAATSLLMMWCSFTPLEWAPLAWVCLVPLSLLLRPVNLPRRWFLTLWLAGTIWATATLQWMRLGHPAMYLAMLALALYLGLYIPVFVLIGRRAVASGVPLWLAVPCAWTALEFARAYLLTGFSWYYLAHTQYRWLSLIQVADITGAYGVSFLVALVSGTLGAFVPESILCRWNLKLTSDSEGGIAVASDPPCRSHQWLAPGVTIALVSAALIYGTIRQMPADEFPKGPVFALIQGNFTPEVKHDPTRVETLYRLHDGLTAQSILLQPDFIVWPETMFSWPEHNVAEGVSDADILKQLPAEVVRSYGNDTAELLKPFRDREVQKMLADYSRMCGAAMVMGLQAFVAEKDSLKTYNSAAVARPDLGYIGRYDKIHRVIFGEYIPMKDLFPWLTNLTPFGAAFGIDAGSEIRMFEYAGARIVPLICFEDTVPHLVRRMAAHVDEQGKGCDVLVNLTNDAWFHGSSELDQHLITSAFRAVETRTPVVRSVNGGISAFIDGNGQVREPDRILMMKEPFEGLRPELSEVQGMRDPETGSWRRQFSGIIFGQAPLDPRSSMYVRFGDWFAAACCLVVITGIVRALLRKPSAA
jgi:apolipoprotein N-acyltransferase